MFKEMRYEASGHGLIVATLMRPFDAAQRGAVTATRFERQLLTHFQRLTAADAALLAKAYAAPDGQVRYSALSRDVTPDIVNDGMPRTGGAAGGSGVPGSATKRAASPNVHLERSLSAGASEEETRAGFRVLLRTLHERRIRIADVFRDFAAKAPFGASGLISRGQMIRALSSVGLATLEPRVVEAMADSYASPADANQCNFLAAIADLEATTYLRGLESAHPDTVNATFSREVATSPNPRFTRPRLSDGEAAALEELRGKLRAQAARDRLANLTLFARSFDKLGEGYLTADRFQRMLATCKLESALAGPALDLILRYYAHRHDARLIDYRGFLHDLGLD